jgi:hypothetical protein
MKNVAHVAHVVMIVVVLAPVPTVPPLVVCVVRLWLATLRLPMAATNLRRLLAPMQINPPLSASAR